MQRPHSRTKCIRHLCVWKMPKVNDWKCLLRVRIATSPGITFVAPFGLYALISLLAYTKRGTIIATCSVCVWVCESVKLLINIVNHLIGSKRVVVRSVRTSRATRRSPLTQKANRCDIVQFFFARHATHELTKSRVYFRAKAHNVVESFRWWCVWCVWCVRSIWRVKWLIVGDSKSCCLLARLSVIYKVKSKLWIWAPNKKIICKTHFWMLLKFNKQQKRKIAINDCLLAIWNYI